jgi:hypothetical protein
MFVFFRFNDHSKLLIVFVLSVLCQIKLGFSREPGVHRRVNKDNLALL